MMYLKQTVLAAILFFIISAVCSANVTKQNIDGSISIRAGKHTVLPIKKTARYATIPYFGTVLTSKNEYTVIATVILPVDNNSDAEAVNNSVKCGTDREWNLFLTFVSGGKDYTYRFNKNEKGLGL